RERRADGDALLLTAGELPRPRAAAIAEPDALEQLVGGAFGLARVAAEQTELEPDRVAAREVGRERAGAVLVEQAGPLGGERGAGAAAGATELDAEHVCGSGTEGLEPRDGAEQGRLPAPAGAERDDDLARVDREREALQRCGPAARRGKDPE